MSMNVTVQIQLDKKPNKDIYNDMLMAAKSLTNVKNSTRVYISPNNSKKVLAEFTMKKSAQYKVVDQIAKEFKFCLCNQLYDDLTISFSQKQKKTSIPKDIKDEIAEIINKFNKDQTKKQSYFIPYSYKYRGKYLYLNQGGEPICRLTYSGGMKSWEFAIYKYSDNCYDSSEFMFPGAEFVDGSIVGAMKAGMKAYEF